MIENAIEQRRTPSNARSMTPEIGYEVKGVDLARPIPEDEFRAALIDALHRNSAIVIRGQDLTPEQLIAFAARFGKLETHVFTQHLLDGHPEILHLSNIEKDGKVIGRPNPGEFWHTDLTYTRTPNRFSMLYSREIPHDENGVPLGNTLFRSTIAAYDALPEKIKRQLEGLRARHFHLWVRRRHGDEDGIALSEEQKARMQNVFHPVVCVEPEYGRKYLFVNHAHTVRIDGMEEAQSEELLQYLFQHIAQQAPYVHRWKVGDVVIWDNHTTQHFATKDYAWPQRRRMWRLSIVGNPPLGAA